MTNIPNNNQTVVFEYQRPNNKKPNNYQSEDQMEKEFINKHSINLNLQNSIDK